MKNEVLTRNAAICSTILKVFDIPTQKFRKDYNENLQNHFECLYNHNLTSRKLKRYINTLLKTEIENSLEYRLPLNLYDIKKEEDEKSNTYDVD